MAIQWNFNADDYQEQSFAPIPIGDHRVRIKDAEETTSKNGNDMIKLTLEVSGHSGSLWDYIVFMPDNPQMTNRKLGGIFSSFGIQPGNMNVESWKGMVGAVNVKHELYNGENQAKIRYYLGKDKQATLPPWSEPAGKASVTGGGNYAPVTVSDDELPF